MGGLRQYCQWQCGGAAEVGLVVHRRGLRVATDACNTRATALNGQAIMTDDTWGLVRNDLLQRIGKNNFLTWIEPLRMTGIEAGVARFEVPTVFFGDWVSRNYSDQIRSELNRLGEQVDRVEFLVGAARQENGIARAPKNGAVAKSRPAHDDEFKGAALDARFTFDSFVVGKPNELAHAAARRVAEGGPVTFNPLFLYGGVGLGKTHLMHAIAHELQTRNPELRVLYLSAEQFMYRFVQALRERQIMGFKELFRSVDVLMVDDVQFIAGKDSTQEEFFHTFNALVDQNKQIVISADRAPGEIKDLEDRIKSRLQCGLVVDLHPTDYELRLGILQQKVDFYRQQYRGLSISDGVLEFLAHRITTNVRVLEGALTRLFAFASLVGREITLELAQDCLADILRASDRKVTIEEIQRRVAEHYNVRLSDLIGPKRVRTIARPRQIAMYLAKQLTPRSLPEIGRRFGGRDHTTIMHGVRRIEELMTTDSQLSDDLQLLRRQLEG
jgi:chromosomal replication initiator protein